MWQNIKYRLAWRAIGLISNHDVLIKLACQQSMWELKLGQHSATHSYSYLPCCVWINYKWGVSPTLRQQAAPTLNGWANAPVSSLLV